MPTPASQRPRKPAPPPARSRSGPLVLVVLAIAAALAGVWWIREGGRDDKRAKAQASAAAESETPEPPAHVELPPPAPIATQVASSAPDAEPSAAPSQDASAAPDAMTTMELADLAEEHLSREAAKCLKKRDKAKDDQGISVMYMLHVQGGAATTSDAEVVDSDLDKELEACMLDRIRKARWDAPGAADVTMKRNFSRRLGDFVYGDGGT